MHVNPALQSFGTRSELDEIYTSLQALPCLLKFHSSELGYERKVARSREITQRSNSVLVQKELLVCVWLQA